MRVRSFVFIMVLCECDVFVSPFNFISKNEIRAIKKSEEVTEKGSDHFTPTPQIGCGLSTNNGLQSRQQSIWHAIHGVLKAHLNGQNMRGAEKHNLDTDTR